MSKTMQDIVLRDAMHNLCPRSGASDEYCKGMVLGLVAGMVASGYTYVQAVERLKHARPNREHRHIEPMGWGIFDD